MLRRQGFLLTPGASPADDSEPDENASNNSRASSSIGLDLKEDGAFFLEYKRKGILEPMYLFGQRTNPVTE